MVDEVIPDTYLQKDLSAFKLPDEYKIDILPGRIEIRHIPTARGIAIDPRHYASVAAGILAFGMQCGTMKTSEPPEKWKEDLPARHVANDRVALELVELANDDHHKEPVLRAKDMQSAGKTTTAYVVKVDGVESGYIHALAEKRFILSVPSLNPDKSVHRGFEAAVHRLAMLVEHPAVRDLT